MGGSQAFQNKTLGVVGNVLIIPHSLTIRLDTKLSTKASPQISLEGKSNQK